MLSRFNILPRVFYLLTIFKVRSKIFKVQNFLFELATPWYRTMHGTLHSCLHMDPRVLLRVGEPAWRRGAHHCRAIGGGSREWGGTIRVARGLTGGNRAGGTPRRRGRRDDVGDVDRWRCRCFYLRPPTPCICAHVCVRR